MIEDYQKSFHKLEKDFVETQSKRNFEISSTNSFGRDKGLFLGSSIIRV